MADKPVFTQDGAIIPKMQIIKEGAPIPTIQALSQRGAPIPTMQAVSSTASGIPAASAATTTSSPGGKTKS